MDKDEGVRTGSGWAVPLLSRQAWGKTGGAATLNCAKKILPALTHTLYFYTDACETFLKPILCLHHGRAAAATLHTSTPGACEPLLKSILRLHDGRIPAAARPWMLQELDEERHVRLCTCKVNVWTSVAPS